MKDRFMKWLCSFGYLFNPDTEYRKIMCKSTPPPRKPIYDEKLDRVWPADMPEFVCKLFRDRGLTCGRLVGASKTMYRTDHRDNVVVFNSNVLVESAGGSGKVWYGDLDVTKSREVLESIAKVIGEPLYILREHDCRFSEEEKMFSELKDKAVEVIKSV